MDRNQFPDTAEYYVDHPQALVELCGRLEGSGWLALDTEFMREKTYFPQLCLIQVANDQLIACVDALALEKLDPLLDVIEDPGMTKVLHAAGQDLEVLYNLRGRIPKPLFDTQAAASLLGFDKQASYAALVQHYCHKTLDKTHSRTDWSRRPLGEAQLRYAIDDVRYLGPLYNILSGELAKLNRLEWLEEESIRIADPANYFASPEQAWRRIRGTDQLRDESLAALQALAAWRERQAMRENRPRRWVLRDDALMELANRLPERREHLDALRAMAPRAAQRYGGALLETIREAAAKGTREGSAAELPTRLDPGQEADVSALMTRLRDICARERIDAAAVGTRRELARMVHGERRLDLLRGWRYTLAGRTLLELLNTRRQRAEQLQAEDN